MLLLFCSNSTGSICCGFVVHLCCTITNPHKSNGQWSLSTTPTTLRDTILLKTWRYISRLLTYLLTYTVGYWYRVTLNQLIGRSLASIIQNRLIYHIATAHKRVNCLLVHARSNPRTNSHILRRIQRRL